MEEEGIIELEEFLAREMLQLSFKKSTINKASKKFNITKEEVDVYYKSTRYKIRSQAAKRAWTYLLLGSVSMFIGITGTFGNTGYIFWGALLLGTGSIITSIGLFKLSLYRKP